MNEYYKSQLESALEYQDFVIKQLCRYGIFIGAYSSRKYQYEVGESTCGIEIKHDDLMKRTGNVYIEVAEKSDASLPEYTLSGIFRKDNSWLYLIGDYTDAYMFSKWQLQHIYRVNKRNKENGEPLWEGFTPRQTPTSIAFTYKIEAARKHGYILKHFVFSGGK